MIPDGKRRLGDFWNRIQSDHQPPRRFSCQKKNLSERKAGKGILLAIRISLRLSLRYFVFFFLSSLSPFFLFYFKFPRKNPFIREEVDIRVQPFYTQLPEKFYSLSSLLCCVAAVGFLRNDHSTVDRAPMRLEKIRRNNTGLKARLSRDLSILHKPAGSFFPVSLLLFLTRNYKILLPIQIHQHNSRRR
jgi:hypothetical protein